VHAASCGLRIPVCAYKILNKAYKPQLTLYEETRDYSGLSCLIAASACIEQEERIVHSGADALDGDRLPKMQLASNAA
jgi:hypothetical protein